MDLSNSKLPKVVVILGVTASGKTKLGIDLAKKFKGEIVSADSRQIYKEFNIGTAKPAGHWMLAEGERKFVASGVVHYLVDKIDPKEDFNLSDYKKLALEKIKEINNKNRLPFLVGGTALYLKTVCENWEIPEVKPNLALRHKLENKKTESLHVELKKLDPEAAVVTSLNKRRIIRALEVIYATGRKFSEQRKKGQPFFDCLKLGIKISKEEYPQRIAKRTEQMIKTGLVAEVKKLHKKYSRLLVPMQSIDYQEFKEYFEGKKTLAETVDLINQHHLNFARRQMMWFKKDKDIIWITSQKEAEGKIKSFLN
ncbi:MAG: tRNA (adenosine(37)-N6)-dimethylallyltransferase MiaA [bacterium]|nr:tRNA (adenosine(37)-N6)-dimethylallyltransferase MiaA [bacterium]